MSIEQDIGRQCPAAVSDALPRNMRLRDDKRGMMIVASYGAAAAIGAANGAFAAFMDGPEAIDEKFVDQLWANILRPMVLGGAAAALSTAQGEGA